MKIAFTCNRFGTRGAERVICNIANQMIADNHQVKIICLDIIPGFYYAIDPRVEVVELDKKISKRSAWVRRKAAGIANFIRLFGAIKGTDIVISFYTKQNCYSILACKLRGIKIVCAERDHFFLYDGKINDILRRVMYPYADGFIHQTEMARRWLRKNAGVKCKDIVIPNPLWIHDFPAYKPKAGFVSAVGRLAEQKNYQGMINAFVLVHKQIPEARLHVFGDGPLHERLQEQIDSVGLHGVVVLEGLTHDVISIYTQTEVFVLFSNGEGYPNALMEALAIGVPSVSVDCPVGGPRDMIEDGLNGYLVECDDTAGFAERIITLLRSKKLQEDFSAEAIKIRNTNEFAAIYQKWMQYLEGIVNHAEGTEN